jgi:menaquinone-specific isochorismate synthase
MSQRLLDPISLIEKAFLNIPFEPEIISLKKESFPYMRLEFPFPEIDLFSWLEKQSLYPKLYFETAEMGIKVAGVGSAFSIETLPSFLSAKSSPRFFGGMDFFPRKTTTWGNFPSCRYFLPLIEIEKRQNMTYLCVNRVAETLDLSPFSFDAPLLSPTEYTPIKRKDFPSFPSWNDKVENILSSIEKKRLEKLVLARASLLEFDTPLSPFKLLKHANQIPQKGTRFAFQFSQDQAFIGISPESLYKREGRKIETAAIAGTRKRGKTEEEDFRLQKELLENDKEKREFAFVKKQLTTDLSSLCTSFEGEQTDSIIQTATTQHLYHRFRGTLYEDIDDQALVHKLHPTPAVGGVPTSSALHTIQQSEPFDRGWYSAPIGWISPHRAHLLVAIRSALIQSHQLYLFAGAGIVPGSSPKKEWEELEQKISQWIKG